MSSCPEKIESKPGRTVCDSVYYKEKRGGLSKLKGQGEKKEAPPVVKDASFFGPLP
jgi:hypothetical protein